MRHMNGLNVLSSDPFDGVALGEFGHADHVGGRDDLGEGEIRLQGQVRRHPRLATVRGTLTEIQSNSDKRNSLGGEERVSFIHSFFWKKKSPFKMFLHNSAANFSCFLKLRHVF